MIVLIRKKAGVIAAIMASAMLITLFVGLIFSGKSSHLPIAQPNHENAIATIGNVPIPFEKYAEQLNQLAARYGITTTQKQDPETIEVIQYAAFEQALQYSILLDYANKADVSPRGQDIDTAIQQIVVQYDLKDKDELKQKLKAANVEWDAFESNIQDNVKIQLIANYFQKSTRATDQDLQNRGTSVNVQHIFVRANMFDKDEMATAESRIQSIYKKLQNGEDFTKLAKAYSEDPNTQSTGGQLGWIGANSTVPEFDAAIFAISPGEYSKPFHTPFGYHIVRVTDKKGTPTFVGLNKEAEKTKLLESKQSNAAGVFLRQYISLNKLVIKDPSVNAYYAKQKGDIPSAIGAYNAQISRSTYDPRPHYLLAKLYQENGNATESIAEIKKAVLKGTLSPQLDVPMARIMYADYLKQIGNLASANVEYDRAVQSTKGQLRIMKLVETQLNASGQSARAATIASERQQIEATIQQQSAATQASPTPIKGALKL